MLGRINRQPRRVLQMVDATSPLRVSSFRALARFNKQAAPCIDMEDMDSPHYLFQSSSSHACLYNILWFLFDIQDPLVFSLTQQRIRCVHQCLTCHIPRLGRATNKAVVADRHAYLQPEVIHHNPSRRIQLLPGVMI